MARHRPASETILTNAWMHRGLLAWALLPLAILFGCVAALRRFLFRFKVFKSVRLPVPVIIVGNVFVGGTGKTPLTIWLIERLRAAGYVPGVISRGYGSGHDSPHAVVATSLPQDVGDEPVLIANRVRCPVMVGRNRVDAAQALLIAYPAVNVVVSDDGLQHYALKRDIEIVLFDSRYAGNGWLLPAGPLRESVKRRRDFTIVNAERLPVGAPSGTITMQLRGDVAEALGDRRRSMTLVSLAGARPDSTRTRIAAAAGIGNPARFFDMLRKIGLVFVEIPLADHYDFAQNPFADLDVDVILITEKDAVKCSQIDALESDPRIWVVPVSAHLDESLAEKIVEKLRGYPTT